MASGSRETTKLLNHIQKDAASRVHSNFLDPLSGWVTLAALLAIFFFALFPFNFSPQATAFRREGFFLYWFAPVSKHWRGWLLNVLFFFPIGFGWAWWSRVKGRRRLGGWMATGLGGLLLSYGVEWLQLYIPSRDSSWDDVFTNTLGALAGWLFFRCWGTKCLRLVESAIEDLSAALER